MDRQKAQEALRWDAHPLLLVRLLEDLPDQSDDPEQQWYSWDGPTLWHALEKAWGQRPSPAACETIQAVKTCLASTAPWTDPWLFGHIAVALAAVTDLEHDAHPTPGQCLFAVECMDLIDTTVPFGDPVRRYQAACLLAGGIVWVGAPLTKTDYYLRGYDHRARARAVYHSFARGMTPPIDDDDPGDVAGVRWWVARQWASQRHQHHIFSYEDKVE